MMTGEVNYNDLMYRSQWIMKGNITNGTLETETMPNEFPFTCMFLLSLFIFIVPIIMMNLFFGIAVNDVQRILERSMINQNVKLVNVIWRYEMVLNKLIRFTPQSLEKYIKRPLLSEDMKDSDWPIEKLWPHHLHYF